MFINEFYETSIEIPYPREIIVNTHRQWETSKDTNATNKHKHKNLFLLVGIISSIFVMIASVACVSVRLVNKKNLEYRDDENDDIDWHSIPGDDQYQDENRNDDEVILLPDRERDDILMDDEYNSDYVDFVFFNIGGVDESKKIRTGVDLSIYICPTPGEPLTIDFPDIVSANSADQYHKILLENSSPGSLCTLVEVSVGGELQLKPIGRSYNGQGWEPYRGQDFVTTHTVPLSCADSDLGDCLIFLPPLSAGRKYVLKSYEYSIGERDEAARFLERTTFGATTSEIDAFVADGNDHMDWIRNQMRLPINSHRQFFRERANNFHAETTWMGSLDFGPCEEGARYRKFVFVPKDIGRYLTISTSSIDANYKVLSVGGHIRSVIPGRVKRSISTTNKLVVPDGRYGLSFRCQISRHPLYEHVLFANSMPNCSSFQNNPLKRYISFIGFKATKFAP